jgi:hypothetical protein
LTPVTTLFSKPPAPLISAMCIVFYTLTHPGYKL